MVGSREGWFDAGYCAVPTDLATLARACRAPIDDHREVRVIPGLFQSGIERSAPDCMRGEEVQNFGAIALTGVGEGLLCLPGTHSKIGSASCRARGCLGVLIMGVAVSCNHNIRYSTILI